MLRPPQHQQSLGGDGLLDLPRSLGSCPAKQALLAKSLKLAPGPAWEASKKQTAGPGTLPPLLLFASGWC